MAFDTYQDRARMKSLFGYNMLTSEFKKYGEFFEPIQYNGETRCDLHPRWSTDGKTVTIDSTHSGKRKLLIIHIHE